jgi:hypothetical protein
MSDSTGDLSRRDALRHLGLGATASVSLEAAQHAHEPSLCRKPPPKASMRPSTLRRTNIKPCAAWPISSCQSLDAGAPEFIDYLSSQNKEMGDIYTGGISDRHGNERRHGAAFWTPNLPTRLRCSI